MAMKGGGFGDERHAGVTEEGASLTSNQTTTSVCYLFHNGCPYTLGNYQVGLIYRGSYSRFRLYQVW